MPYLQKENIEIYIATSDVIKPHTHEFLELAYIASGRAKSVLGGKETVIRKGDYFIVDYDTAHSYEKLGEEDLRVINVLFLPQLLDRSLAYCRSFRALLGHYLIRIDAARLNSAPMNCIFTDDDGRIGEYMEKLTAEYEEKRLGFTEIMRSLLIEVLILSMRKISDGETAGSEIGAFVRGEIAKNCVAPPTLAQLANELGYSTAYASVKIKSILGVGYREYVTQVRLEEARRLLANTDKKIADVAECVGYADVNFFYALFKKREGCSPAVFRKRTTEINP